MAKLYRYEDGSAFYDAFGGTIGQVEEVEFRGDTFNRDALSCCIATADIAKSISAEPATLSFTVKDCNWNSDALASLTGISDSNTVSCKTAADVNTVNDRFAELQKQIDELRDKVKVKVKVDSKLRNELHTLKYKREVE